MQHSAILREERTISTVEGRQQQLASRETRRHVLNPVSGAAAFAAFGSEFQLPASDA